MPLLLASEFSYIFDKAVPYFPKKDKGIVTIINTAAIGEGYALDIDKEIAPFEGVGYEVILFDLMSDGGVSEQIKSSDMVYVAGGNTFFLLEHIKKTDFFNALQKRMDKSFLYIGSSAGSIVMSPDIDFIAPMDEKDKANLDDTKGMDMIPFSFLPHVGHCSMGEAASIIKRTYNSFVPLMSINDQQAIYVDGNQIEVLS